MNRLKFISYDGKYPNLCAGILIIELDGVKVTFEPHSLCSGGSVWFDEHWNEYITEGPWSITMPYDFPKELYQELKDLINENIPLGCCGGCV